MPRPRNPPTRVNKLQRNQGVLAFQATRIGPRGKKSPNYLRNKLQQQVQSGKKRKEMNAFAGLSQLFSHSKLGSSPCPTPQPSHHPFETAARLSITSQDAVRAYLVHRDYSPPPFHI